MRPPFLPSPDRQRRHLVTALAATLAAPNAARAERSDIVIGQSAPLSGPMALPMAGVLEGQQLAFDEVNRQGGIDGRPLRVVLLDDAFDPSRTLANARTLVEREQVVALFGTVGTSQTAAVLPYLAQKRVPLVAAYSGSPALREGHHPYFFTTQASYADELVKMARNLVAIRSDRIALVYQNNEFGQHLQPLAEKAVQAEGAAIAVSRALDVNGADAREAAQSVAAARPHAVILIAAGPSVVAYVKGHRALVGVPIYTFSLSVSATTLKALGEEARGLVNTRSTPYPWRATSPLPRSFHQLMERRNRPVDYDHYTGFINARVLIEGLQRAGRNPGPESLTQAMERLGRLDLGGYVVAYSAQNHHGSNFVEITVVGPNGTFLR